MNLTSTSWSCVRCGAAYISTQPEPELELSVQLAPIAHQACPTCGGPVCADCGKALVTLIPLPATSPGRGGEVSSDGG